jgi:hypothetical protein
MAIGLGTIDLLSIYSRDTEKKTDRKWDDSQAHKKYLIFSKVLVRQLAIKKVPKKP